VLFIEKYPYNLAT